MTELPPLPEPFGYLLDGSPEGLRFSRAKPDGIEALVRSIAPVFTDHQVNAAVSAAVAKERERCALIAALHSQYPITTEYDKGYAKARADTAAAIRATPATPKPPAAS